MILFVATLITKLFGIDIAKATRYATILIVILGIILLLFLIFGIKSCFTKEPKIDQKSIEKINSADRKEKIEELNKIIVENQDVIKTNDNRTLETEQNIEEKQRQIDAKIAEADKKIQEAKNNGRDVTQEELKCILIPENCQ